VSTNLTFVENFDLYFAIKLGLYNNTFVIENGSQYYDYPNEEIPLGPCTDDRFDNYTTFNEIV